MINKELLQPRSIVVVGASPNTKKPGGKILQNIISGGFKGALFVINPKYNEVQGVLSYSKATDIRGNIDLAIIAVPSIYCFPVIEELAKEKQTKAFIIISAGFSETGASGKHLEEQLVEIVKNAGATLVGPNCIGVLTPHYNGIFTQPIPLLDPQGCDFISHSGATASFIFESAIPKGLKFASLFSIGNGAHITTEKILQYMDETFDTKTSPKVKMLYLEEINNPDMLLKHASSLIRKGCKIVAIKAGSSEAGSRAAASHTGAMTNSDVAVDALFRKAGIIRCHSRRELVAVASVLQHPELLGKNIAVVTHAGGPAVMCTDSLSKHGLIVPRIDNEYSPFLLTELAPGSAISNPIDFLATGTAEHLRNILNYTENKFNEIDGIIVIFGKPGLSEIYDVMQVIHERKQIGKKPIYTVIPSITTAKNEIEYFLANDNIVFPDEVGLASALAKVYNTPSPVPEQTFPMYDMGVDIVKIRSVIDKANDGYLSPFQIGQLFDSANIPHIREVIVTDYTEIDMAIGLLGLPIVMKATGHVHKSDIGGVSLNIRTQQQANKEFDRLMKISGTEAVIVQPMLEKGMELFIGAKYEPHFGHIILCGMGGIFVEAMKDVAAGLAPLTHEEATEMIRSLRSYKIIEGLRGQPGVDIDEFADILVRLSVLLRHAVEIKEMDLNPLIASQKHIVAVDIRIFIKKEEN